jgi:hypothetical protein
LIEISTMYVLLIDWKNVLDRTIGR